MKLDMFRFIDSAVEYVNLKRDFIDQVAEECDRFFTETLCDNDFFLNLNYRVKSDNSIKEKLLRISDFNAMSHPRNVFNTLSDILGLRIECRFISEEEEIFFKLKEIFSETKDGVYYRSPLNEYIYLNFKDPQPQYQKNGFEIYKIDGKYIDGEEELFFELQIKSMVNVFWGEIDHRILYKNFNYMITEDFIRNLMYSIKNNLEMVDSQLNTIYQRLKDMEESNEDNTLDQLKSFLSKALHDTYVLKMQKETGVLIDLRAISNTVIDFLLMEKNEKESTGSVNTKVIDILHRINQLNRKKMVFGENLEFGQVEYRNKLNKKLGESLKKQANVDFRWNMILMIVFDLEGKKSPQIYKDFVNYLVHCISSVVDEVFEDINLNKRKKQDFKYEILNEVLNFYCEKLDIKHFTKEGQRKLSIVLNQYLEGLPEDFDLKDFNPEIIIGLLEVSQNRGVM